ncbi:MAG: tetratricopeptide repeat protein [Cyanobacteria bacterium LVE1205-1]
MEKRRRWLIQVVLIIILVSFVGFSLLPLLGGVLQPSSRNSSTASPSGSQTTKNGELDAQAKGYELVLQREPENQTALKNLIDIQIQRQDLKGAAKALEKLSQLNPKETRYLTLLAQVNQELGNGETAMIAYRQVLDYEPGNLSALQGLTGLFLQQNQPESAINLLQDTLNRPPSKNSDPSQQIDKLSLQLILGSVYTEQKRFDEAIALYEEVAKNNPTDFRPIAAQAIVRQRQGQPDQAKALFDTAISLAPPQFKDQIKKLATDSQTLGGATPSNTPSPSTSPAAP